jgi:HD superfamily phosphohydrolase
MNVENLFSWLPQDEKLKPFYDGIVDFVSKYINLSNPKQYKHSKEILDPVVGYVKIYSWEMAMLDTLLFQRLRKITQLGLANLVYPSLNYTRFEHTIGTIGRLNQVLTRLRERHKPQEYENEKIDVSIIDKYETQIRLAALFHDVGHCMFSHLTEFAMNGLKGGKHKDKTGKPIDYPSVEMIKNIFNDEFAKERYKLSLFEIFSITILGTRQVAEILFSNNIALFTYKDGEKIKNIEELESVLEHVARFIAGLPIENKPETIFLAQLMSSGLDVDKLDYMSREEHFSGIKIEMDLQRIFNKINIFSISPDKSPESLEKYTKHIHPKHNEQNITEEFIILGIEKGGQYSYEEFCMARLSLYEKIYLHKKVRAAEAFLKKKLTEFVTYDHEYQQAHKWLYLPESIIEEKLPYKTEKEVIVEGELFSRPETIQENIKFSDIIERKIPDRAFGFGPANSKTDSSVKNEKGELLSENELNNIHSIALWKFLMDTGNVKAVDSLRKAILKEAESISTFLLEKNLEYKEFVINKEDDKKIIEGTLVFDIPDWKRVKLNPQTLYFKDAGFNTINWTIPVDKIHTYYQLHRILAHVYVNYKFCPLIYLATERVLYKYKIDNNLTNFVFDQTQAVSGNVYEKAEKIKQELSKNEYYNNYEDLIPLDETLTTSFAIEKIQSVVRLLGSINCKKNRNISTLDVERFLKQFDRTIQLPMLHLISNIKVLFPENELPEKIKEIRERIDKDKKIGVLPLGDFMNSSSNLLKNLKDTFSENNITSINVNSDLIKNLDYILVIDDNINTGIQCLNIMMRYLGYDRTNIPGEEKQKELWMDLESKRGDIQEGIKREFSEELKKKKFEFLFIVGHETSAETLKSYLKNYCKLKPKNFNITIIHTLKGNDKILSGEYGGYSEKSIFGNIKKKFDENVTKREETQKILKILTEVGTELVKKKNIVTKYKQKPENNSLGYRNRENLVIFANSIPAMTYTALWCEGKYNKKDWYPLIPRK